MVTTSPVIVGRHEQAGDRQSGRERSRGRWALALVCSATFMLVLDLTIVNVALPSIQTSLHASLTTLEWVIDAYALALAALLLISGSLADRYGRRRVFRVGLGMFTFGSLACSVASSSSVLVVSRAVQGIGGAALFATALAILGQEFQGKSRGRALGVWGAAVALGLAVGPLAGGVLTDLISWRAIFFVNVPLGTVAFVLAGTRLHESRDPDGTPLDWPGALTFALTLLLLTFGFVEGNTRGWSSPPIVASFVGACGFGIAFVWIEHARSGLVDLSLFRLRTFDAATLGVIGQGFVIGPLLFYLVRYLQEVLGASPLRAGLEIVPMTVTCFVAAILAGRATSRVPIRLLLAASLGLLGCGVLLMLFVRESTSWTVVVPGLLIAGAGWGAVNPVAAEGALSSVPPERSGMASGINGTGRQVGIAIGLGALGAVFQRRLQSVLTAEVARRHLLVPPGTVRLAARGGLHSAAAAVPPTQRAGFVAASRVASTAALHGVLLVGGIGAIAVGIAIALLRD
ncbi:MAG: transporter [Actinomycetia bacterium]|nr:transporter [Actinomycetes bacterium]